MMRTHLALVATLAVVPTLSACDAYDTDLGPTPYFCGDTDPVCPDGYACMEDPLTAEMICVSSNTAIDTEFDCADDSAYEPNNGLTEATPTSLDTMASFSLSGLSVCPTRDRDLFAIPLAMTSSSVELVVNFDAGGAMLDAAILNEGGIPIAAATTTADAPRTLRAFTQNLPAGQYYAQVSGPGDPDVLSVNNYAIEITVGGP
jgi:hypothetical protein